MLVCVLGTLPTLAGCPVAVEELQPGGSGLQPGGGPDEPEHRRSHVRWLPQDLRSAQLEALQPGGKPRGEPFIVICVVFVWSFCLFCFVLFFSSQFIT